VPDALAGDVRVGTIVRVELHGRRVGGWVVALDDQAPDRALKPLAKVTGAGPSPDLVDLAAWASWRWAGRRAVFLGTASPPRAVPPSRSPGADRAPAATAARGTDREVYVHRVPPAADVLALALATASTGAALILAPSHAMASDLASRLRAENVATALLPGDWERAAAGAAVALGTRAAAWAPRPHLASVLVVDEHDGAYQEERAPTWHARDVAIERARRAGAACTLSSPCPSLDALEAARLVTPARVDERGGWPVVEVVDRRREPPGLGLFSERLAAVARDAKRMVCVLNRKGRARLLACGVCGELARCERCEAAVQQHDDALRCGRCGATRPGVCAECGSTRLKTLRVGVARAAEDLEALVRRPVAEVTAEGTSRQRAPILVGTEAVLHRVRGADVVAFIDLDQELLAPRYRAAEESMALLARAARLVGGRNDGGRLLLQTRLPDHEVVMAVVHADPGRYVGRERGRRTELGFPPVRAMAAVSGEVAGAYVDGLRAANGDLDFLGPADGRWLVRAPDHNRLCDALAAVPRPPGRLRVNVDPSR
jgi:primosomal protein N' (replication factor Y)